MAYSNQKPQLFEQMNFRENLLLWSKDQPSDDEIRKVLQDLRLDKFAGKLDQEIKHASGGELVRIGIARTLLKQPKIMILDEPTAALDSQSAQEVREILLDIHTKRPDTTIICVSHDDGLITMSDRAIYLEQGVVSKDRSSSPT